MTSATDVYQVKKKKNGIYKRNYGKQIKEWYMVGSLSKETFVKKTLGYDKILIDIFIHELIKKYNINNQT